ncbi:MAG: class II glutamine amidotransferase [Arenicellales bacterium]
MCRWLAYSGGDIPLAELIFNTRHSLIDQSLSSHSSPQTTNGDGFGVGWYDGLDAPGLYKHTQPAWNDANFNDLCTHIRSPLFIAHVRASTGTAIQHSNCHPFRYGPLLLVHNGHIRDFHRLRRQLAIELEDNYFREIAGSTDSELMFLLALQFGMATDVYEGVARMVGFVEQVGRAAGIEHPMQMTLGISDGKKLYAVRYSSEGNSRTLFCSRDVRALQEELSPEQTALAKQLTNDARCVVSEPLSDLRELWEPIAESTFVTIEGGHLESRPFQPIQP